VPFRNELISTQIRVLFAVGRIVARAEPTMAVGQTPTQRIQITLSVKTQKYLATLAQKGTHGTNIVDVARTLIESGIRQAIKDSFITIDDSL
jgi:hypothetical protein